MKIFLLFTFLVSCNLTQSTATISKTSTEGIGGGSTDDTAQAPQENPGSGNEQPSGSVIDRTNGDSEKGANLYISEGCLSCHGNDGMGGAYAVAIDQASDREIYNFIKDGGGDMPAIALSDSEIQDIAAYIGNRFVP